MLNSTRLCLVPWLWVRCPLGTLCGSFFSPLCLPVEDVEVLGILSFSPRNMPLSYFSQEVSPLEDVALGIRLLSSASVEGKFSSFSKNAHGLLFGNDFVSRYFWRFATRILPQRIKKACHGSLGGCWLSISLEEYVLTELLSPCLYLTVLSGAACRAFFRERSTIFQFFSI